MEGRFIGINVRRLMDLLHYVENERIEAILISVDFSKCFDMIEFQAIDGTLKYFNFGEKFIQMVFLLYNGFQTKVLYNGYTSQYFTPEKGIHQGCAISGYLFLLTAEILTHNIKANKAIKGIPIADSDEPETVSQFVDDMTVASLFDKESIGAITGELRKFQANTGLTTNFEKTKIFRIGALKNTDKILKTEENFTWEDTNLNILGVILDDYDTSQNAYSKIIEKLSVITRMWQQ